MLSAPPFSDLVIDRYLADELPANERAAFEERCRSEPTLLARVDELRASRRAFSTASPSFEAITARAAARASWWERIAHNMQARVALVGAVAAAAVLFVVVDTGDDVRTKGGRFVDFIVDREGTVITGAPGMTLQPNDRVQFVVDAGAGAFVSVWSKDGAGTVSRYAPASSAWVRAQGRHTFENSTRLDDVLGDESFVGVRCAMELHASMIEAAVQAGDAPAGCAFDRVRVRKVQRP